MTSTVLDVTVFLLCVSASVVTLLTGGPVPVGDTPDARAMADSVATETGTVTFTVQAEGEPRGRRHQGTLAELLASAVTTSAVDDSSRNRGSPSGASDAGGTYTEAVLDLLAERIGPRVRVIGRSNQRPNDVVVGGGPPPDATVAVARVPVPVEGQSAPVRIVVQRWSHA